MKIRLLFLFIVVLLCNCDSNRLPKQFTAKYIIDINDPVQLSIDDFVTDIDTIKLEVTNESLLKDIYHTQIMDGRIYIVSNQFREVYIFDLDGKYVNKIVDMGQGPKEYIRIHDMQVDLENKRVILTDNFSKRIFVYDRDGKQMDVINLDFHPCSILPYKNGFISVNSNNRKNSIIEYNITFLDSVGQTVSVAFKNELANDVDVSSRFSTAIHNDGNILYQPVFSNIVYKIQDESITPYYEFNNKSKLKFLTEKEQRKFEYKFGKRNTLKEKEDSGYLLTWGEVIDTDEYVLFIFRGEDICRNLYFNKKHSKSYLIDPAVYKGDKNTIDFFVNYICAADNDRFYISPSEYIVSKIKGKINLKDNKIKTFLDNLDFNSNPPLISFKIKFPE